jgi:hypothetical protein
MKMRHTRIFLLVLASITQIVLGDAASQNYSALDVQTRSTIEATLSELSRNEPGSFEEYQLLKSFLSRIEGRDKEMLSAMLLYEDEQRKRGNTDSQITRDIDRLRFYLEEEIPSEDLIALAISHFERDSRLPPATLVALIIRACNRRSLAGWTEVVPAVLKNADTIPIKFLTYIYTTDPANALAICMKAYFPDAVDTKVLSECQSAFELNNDTQSQLPLAPGEELSRIDEWSLDSENFLRSERWPVRAFSASMLIRYKYLRKQSSIDALSADPHPLVAALAEQIGPVETPHETEVRRVRANNSEDLGDIQ